MVSPSALELPQSTQAVLQAEAAAVTAARETAAADRFCLDRERQSMGVAPAGAGEVITVNVGGTLFTTRRHTFTAARGSLLSAMFSGRWEESLSRDAAGHVFLDDDPAVFARVLAALRARAADSASPVPRDTNHRLEPSAEVIAFVDKYQLRDHLWPVPFGVTTITSAGAAVCEVASAQMGRAVCVAGGPQLPHPIGYATLPWVPLAVPVQPPGAFNLGAQAAAGIPQGLGAMPAAGGGRRERRVHRSWNEQPTGPASRVIPRSVFRSGPPFGGGVPPLPTPFDPLKAVLRHSGNVPSFGKGLLGWMAEILDRCSGKQPPAKIYSAPLSNFTLTEINPGASQWAITLRQLSDGALIGVATAADDVHGVFFLRNLHPWGAYDACAAQPPTRQSPSWSFLPVLDGDVFLPEQFAPESRWLVDYNEDVLGPQLAYCSGEGLLKTVHEDCSLLFELRAAPHASSTTTCLVISMMLGGEEDQLLLSRLCAIPLPKIETPWSIYIQPMPENDVLVHHMVDAIQPEVRVV